MHNGLISDVRENSLIVSLLTQLKTLCIIQFVINGLGIIASILMFIPACSTNQENIQRRRRLVMPCVVWCIVKMAYSAGFYIWFFVKVSHELHDLYRVTHEKVSQKTILHANSGICNV